MLGPMGVALIAAGAAWVAFNEIMEESSKAMDEFADKAANPILGDTAKRSKEAIDEVIESIKKEGEALDIVIGKRQKELALVRLQANEALARVSSGAALETAKIDSKVSSGELSPAEGIAARAQIAQDAADAVDKVNTKKRNLENESEQKDADDANKLHAEALEKRAELERRAAQKGVVFTDEQKEEYAELNRQAAKAQEAASSIKPGDITNTEERATRDKGKKDLERITAERFEFLKNAENKNNIDIADRRKEINAEVEKTKIKAEKETEQARSTKEKNASAERTQKTRGDAAREIRGIKTGDSVTSSEAKAKAAKEKEARAIEKKNARDKIKAKEKGLKSDVRSAVRTAEGLAGKTRGNKEGTRLKKALDDIAFLLKDGTNAAELAKIAEMLGTSNAAQLDIMKLAVERMAQQQAELLKLKELLKKDRL